MELVPRRYLKETHRDWLVMLPVRAQQVGLLVLVLMLVVLPLRASGYLLHLLTTTATAVVGAIGLNFLTGFTGQVSLGQAAFLAIGAYTTAIVGKLGLPFGAAILAAGAVTALAAVLVGIPSLRLKGFYLAMATYVFHHIVITVISRWRLLGGQSGLPVNRPAMIRSDLGFYYLTAAVAALLVYCAFNIERSYLSRAWGAIRDRDLAASAMGISLTRYKLLAYAWSGFYVGIAGGLLGAYLRFIAPDYFPFLTAIQYLGMVLVGGLGTVLGSIFGAVFMTIVPEGIRLLAAAVGQHLVLPPTFNGDAQLVVFGVIIVVTVVYAPKGLFGFWEDVKLYFRTWPFSY